ncbi:MAG: heme o synthase [Candidatus Thermoplasmatota archaeon]|jgi:protoheme IX farnesyltransferase|nr:heme o synthase [Candidatus Thermoplasmatota archaeon]
MPRPTAGDFFQLMKPGITLFIVMVSVAGFFTVSPYPPNLRDLGWLVLSGTLGAAGSAALNHYYDRDIDVKMKRTRSRPLPMESIPPTAAMAFGTALIAGALLSAYFELNWAVAASIASGAFVYVVVYTMLLKRETPWGTVIGGYAGSAAVLGGGAAVTGGFSLPVIVLALIVFLWTPPHFWSLAIALSSDFGRADLPALPRSSGVRQSARAVVVSAALLLPPTVAFAFLGTLYYPFLVGGLVAGVLFLLVTTRILADSSRKVAMRAFIASGFYLVAISVAMVVNWLLVQGPFFHLA